MSHSMQAHFSSITDRRQLSKIEHPLVDIIILCICGVVCGADGWSDIEVFGRTHKGWLQGKGLLPNGIPVAKCFMTPLLESCLHWPPKSSNQALLAG